MTPRVIPLYPVIMPVTRTDRSLDGRQRVRRLSLLARQALERSCRISGLRLERLPKDDAGAPLPVDGVYWSISHKIEIVGGVAAPVAVGFDLETLRDVNDALLSRVADRHEWRLAGGRCPSAFFRLWTAKEAVLKAVGKGFAGMSRCRVVEVIDRCRMVLDYDHEPWPVVHHWFDGHVAALAAHHCEPVWQWIEAKAPQR